MVEECIRRIGQLTTLKMVAGEKTLEWYISQPHHKSASYWIEQVKLKQTPTEAHFVTSIYIIS